MLSLWTQFTSLTWWQMILWVAYLLYFLIRSHSIWVLTSEYGIRKGYKYVFFGENPKYFRLYHLVRMLFDIPPSIIGLTFPFFKAVLKFKIYEFKPEKKEDEKKF